MAAERRLDGKVAIVTGASSGIGLAGARRLVQAGATVVLAARRADRLRLVAERLNRDGRGRAIVAVADISREADRVAVIDRACQETGDIHILVNNAGFGQAGAVEEMRLEQMRAQFETNFFGAVHLMQLVLPLMRARGAGRIINVSSVNGRLAVPGLATYCATKFALEAVSDAARVELCPFGVHVALVAPGPIKTEIWGVGRALARDTVDQTSPYGSVYAAVDSAAARAERSGADPAVVARAIFHAATSAHPKARYVMPLEGWISALVAYLPATARDGIISHALRVPRRPRSGPGQETT